MLQHSNMGVDARSHCAILPKKKKPVGLFTMDSRPLRGLVLPAGACSCADGGGNDKKKTCFLELASHFRTPYRGLLATACVLSKTFR